MVIERLIDIKIGLSQCESRLIATLGSRVIGNGGDKRSLRRTPLKSMSMKCKMIVETVPCPGTKLDAVAPLSAE
jgi:hypothetical protein